jgi:ABC-2 type transport system permease protein
MLWYKAWLETRTRFAISLIGIIGLCGYFLQRQDRQRLHWTNQKLRYYYEAFFGTHQMVAVLWVVAVVLLAMGGVVREKAVGSSSFTLALPVSRARIMQARIGMGLIEAAALGLLSWAAMFATAAIFGKPLAIGETILYPVLLFAGGVSLFAVAVLASSLLEGEYTAPLVAYGTIIGLSIVLGDPSMNAFNVWRVMKADALLDKTTQTLTGPFPWPQVIGSCIAAVLLLAASIKIVERREF